MRFLFFESYYGGSHADFADGLTAHSRHEIDLVTMPARFWKWRMRGAALYFVGRKPSPAGYDGIIVTDLMSLSDLKSLWGAQCPPALVYFHENQLSYPLPPGQSMDYQFGFTDITTALAADRVLFNSHFHRDTFLRGLPGFIRKMPELKPLWVVGAIESKSSVLYPGCSFTPGAADSPQKTSETRGRPLVIWNHRWEFDKCPEVFFRALGQALDKGLDFDIALLGENFQAVPKPFLDAGERFRDRVVQYGHVPSKDAYFSWLGKGDLVISTAIQENFGIAVIEAIRHGCFPLLPSRLSYPELIPNRFHAECLYDSEDELGRKLEAFLLDSTAWLGVREELALWAGRFSWETVSPAFDDELDRLAAGRGFADRRPADRRLNDLR